MAKESTEKKYFLEISEIFFLGLFLVKNIILKKIILIG